jgi:geranylgeranyl pyrophosphate synthase
MAEECKKGTSNRVARHRVMIKVLDILGRKSRHAIIEAKKMILAENIESKNARKALQYYSRNWDDTTHPGILALACEAVGGKIEDAIPMQIVILYFTAALDLHDDIIDQSKTKNGRPTVFGKYGSNISLLLGDAMMIKGYTLMFDYSQALSTEISDTIAHALETYFFEIGNAHLLEIDIRKTEVSPATYFAILEKKSSIIEANARLGAIIGGASLEEIRNITRFGQILGILIALREEFIDIFEPKELQNRMKNEILPLPLLYALDQARTKDRILSIISQPKISEQGTREIVEYVFRSRHVKELLTHAEGLAEEALEIVRNLRETKARTNLTTIINGALEDIRQ